MTREATAQATVMILRESRDKHYSGKILDAFSDVSRRLFRSEVILMKTEMLDEHMALDEDLKSVAGMLLVSKGSPITESLLFRLCNFRDRRMLPDHVRVLVPISYVTTLRGRVGEKMKVLKEEE